MGRLRLLALLVLLMVAVVAVAKTTTPLMKLPVTHNADQDEGLSIIDDWVGSLTNGGNVRYTRWYRDLPTLAPPLPLSRDGHASDARGDRPVEVLCLDCIPGSLPATPCDCTPECGLGAPCTCTAPCGAICVNDGRIGSPGPGKTPAEVGWRCDVNLAVGEGTGPGDCFNCEDLTSCSNPCVNGLSASAPIQMGETCAAPSVSLVDEASTLDPGAFPGCTNYYDGRTTTDPGQLCRDESALPTSLVARERLRITESVQIGNPATQPLVAGEWQTACTETPGFCDSSRFGVHYLDCRVPVDCLCDGARWCYVGRPDFCGDATSCFGATSTSTTTSTSMTTAAPTTSTTSTSTIPPTTTTLGLVGSLGITTSFPGTYTNSQPPDVLACQVVRMPATVTGTHLSLEWDGDGACAMALYPDTNAGAQLAVVTDACPSAGTRLSGGFAPLTLGGGVQYRFCHCASAGARYLGIYGGGTRTLLNAFSVAYGSAAHPCVGGIPPATTGALTALGSGNEPFMVFE